MNESRPRRKDIFLSKELGDETVLYTSDGKTIHILNATARVVWELCDGEHTAAEMGEAVRRRFAISEEESVDVAADIQKVLATFAEKGLLESQ